MRVLAGRVDEPLNDWTRVGATPDGVRAPLTGLVPAALAAAPAARDRAAATADARDAGEELARLPEMRVFRDAPVLLA